MRLGRRVRRTRDGDFELRLPADERALLANVVPQLRQLLDGDLADPSLRRLFPTAYADDPERDREYHALVRDELADRRKASIETVLATVEATRLDEQQLSAWMTAVNDLRLVLGTRLDVSEDSDPEPDPDDPDAALVVLYGYLGYLLDAIVTALSE
jgi:hypothetical protein